MLGHTGLVLRLCLEWCVHESSVKNADDARDGRKDTGIFATLCIFKFFADKADRRRG